MAVTRGATVTQAKDTATPIITSFSHTVDAGSNLLIVTFHCEGDLGISSVTWNTSESMTEISSVTTSSSGGDCRVYAFGLVKPTVTTANVAFTVTGVGDNLACVAVNYAGTHCISLDAATNAINSADNSNNAATTVALTGATVAGSTLVCAATFYGDDGDPAVVTGVTGFADVATSDTGGGSTTTDTSYYYGDKIGGGTGGTLSPTVDWTSTASDECVGIFFEIIDGSFTPTQTKGDATFTGYAPSLAFSWVLSPAAAEPTITGYAPTLLVSQTITQTAGAVAVTGYAPTPKRIQSWGARFAPGTNNIFPRIEAGSTFITPTVGAIEATGQAPQPIEQAGSVNYPYYPAVGELAVTGQAPFASTGYVISPAAGELGITGQAPTLGHTWWFAQSVTAVGGRGSVVSGTITNTQAADDSRLVLAETSGTPGFEYSFSFLNVPSTARSVEFEGYYSGNAAHIVKFYQWNFTGSSWAALTGNTRDLVDAASDQHFHAPLLGVTGDYISGGEIRIGIKHDSAGNITHQLLVDEILLSGLETNAPVLTDLTITGYAPTVSAIVTAEAGALAVTGYAPFIGSGELRQPTVGEATITGYAPTVDISYTFAPAAGDPTITGYAPAIAVDYVLTVPACELSVTADAPTVLAEISFVVDVGATDLAVTGYAPLVGQINSWGARFAPGIDNLFPLYGAGSTFLTPAVAEVTATGQAPSFTVTPSYTFTPAAAELAFAGQTPVVDVTTSPVITPEAAQLGITGHELVLEQIGTCIVTFPFASTAQGFVGTPDAGTTMAWSGTQGNPAGSLLTTTTGRRRDVYNVWSLTTDWATLGVPAGKVITRISAASLQTRVITFTQGQSDDIASTILTPTGRPGITLANSRMYTGAEVGYTTTAGSGATGLEISSGGSLRIEIASNALTTNSGSPNVTIAFDNLTFTVTYTAEKIAIVGASPLTLTGYAPTVSAQVSESQMNSWFRRLTESTNTVEQRYGRGYTEPVLPAVGEASITGYAPALVYASTVLYPAAGTLAVEGAEPDVLGAPISVLGADYLYSDVATITSASVRVIQQGDRVIAQTAASLDIAGYAPTLYVDHRFTPTAAQLVAESATQVWHQDYTVEVGATDLAITGQIPLASSVYVFEPTVGAVDITGYAPSLLERPLITPQTAQVAIQCWDVVCVIGPAALPAAAALDITGYAPTLDVRLIGYPAATDVAIVAAAPTVVIHGVINATGTLQSGDASVATTATVKRKGSGALVSPQPFAFSGAGTRKHRAWGFTILRSGPASLRGTVYLITDPIYSGDASVAGRGHVIEYVPPTLHIKPQRVNRYTVVLKPSPRKRIWRPNTRRPFR